MLTNQTHLLNIETPVRQIQAKVELLNGSTLINAFYHTDYLKSFDIERVGEEKFFGFGICQKINIKLLDVTRKKDITTDNSFRVYLGAEGDYFSPYPTFNVTEVHRNENTNQLSITAYDLINEASKFTVSDLNFVSTVENTEEEKNSYTIREFATACANLLGATALNIVNVTDSAFDTRYEDGANFEGTETIREALNAVAEATQTIYYIDKDNNLVFKRLDKSGDAVYPITKARYITLDSKTNRRLSTITHATELGDNVSASITESGSTQFVRDNPFWEMREDIATLVDNALAALGGLTINQFECEWRGNYLLEIGDKFDITTKDDKTVTSFLLDDTTSYDGAFKQKTRWNYADNEEETASNPTSLGEAIKQTYARVDKANKQIDLVASETKANAQRLSSLEINTDGINASVENLQKSNSEAFDSINGEIETLTNKVNASMTSEQVKLEIKSELANGVTKVETNTGFTFNDEGLTVEKTNSEMKTQITEDGMTVYKNDEAVLTANNIGVDAVNLHATTYLIIGTNSRFEDYGDSRTGCFWIGN